MNKIETIEEYLARGGKVEILPPQVVPYKQIMKMRAKNTILSLYEGEEAYGKKNNSKKPNSAKIAVDTSRLPQDLLAQLRALGEDI